MISPSKSDEILLKPSHYRTLKDRVSFSVLYFIDYQYNKHLKNHILKDWKKSINTVL